MRSTAERLFGGSDKGLSYPLGVLSLADQIVVVEMNGWPRNYTPSSQQRFGSPGGPAVNGPFVHDPLAFRKRREEALESGSPLADWLQPPPNSAA